jgi:hypothetical protein
MAPKGGAFGCRSTRFTGVYKAQRATVRWRTQFSYARKVGMAGMVVVVISFALEDFELCLM